MATTAKRGRVGAAPIELVTPDNPRIVERTSDGARARVTDQGEYVSMTTGMGYRDITESGPQFQGSNVGTGGGRATTTGNASNVTTGGAA